ncbi:MULTISPECIES: MATE family efflux transporter [unclassified Streptomyces]|uniref:MATE family efflux transporter n=1 Tax=unclassified Streptomyces TaxID=2593676 RepID=UPI000A86F105|nr:MATE family efflux transporter [Streptomyces sp. CB02058]
MPPKGNLGVFSLSWPIFLQLLSTYSMGLVDVWALGRVSDDAAGAVGSVNTVATFVLMMFSFMGQGGSLVYARALGRGEPGQVREYYFVALLLHVILGAAVSIALFVLADDVAGLMGLRGQHLAYGTTFLQIVGGSAVLHSLVAMLGGVLAANGFTRHAMFAAVFTNVVNVVLIIVLVLSTSGPRWGVRGVALSTALATCAGLLYSLWLVFFRIRIRFRRPGTMGQWKAHAALLVSFSLPTMLEPAFWQLAQIVTTRIISAVGTDELAARMYTLSITNMIGMFSSALSQGLQIALGHLAGAGETQRIRRLARNTRAVGAVAAVALALVTGVCGGWIMRGFTADPEVADAGKLLLWCGLLYLPGSSLIMTTASSLRAVGHVVFPAVVGIVVLWAVFLPLAYALSLPLGLGILGVMIAMAVDENLRALLMDIRWRRLPGKRQEHLALPEQTKRASVSDI